MLYESTTIHWFIPFLNSEYYYDSDATQFSGSDDGDIEGNFELIDVDYEHLDMWILPLFYLARGIKVLINLLLVLFKKLIY